MTAGFTHEPSNSADVEWYTPPWVFEALGPLRFDLDPASPMEGPLPWIPANWHYTKADDGLAQQWFGKVWLNPPYGRTIGRWTKRMADHGNGLLLVFSRTEVDWFHDDVCRADAILFHKQRISFVGRDGQPKPGKGGKISSPGSGSLIAAWGEECVNALINSSLKGAVWFLK